MNIRPNKGPVDVRVVLDKCTNVHCLAQNFDDVKTLFMQSDGGLTPMHDFRGSRAILSGPAGGVVGYATTSYGTNTGGDDDGSKGACGGGEEETSAVPVIGFDMGGTSTGARLRACNSGEGRRGE